MTQQIVDPKKKKFSQSNNPAEILKEFGGEIASVPNDLYKEAKNQILGVRKPMSGEIKLGSGTHAQVDQPRPAEQQPQVSHEAKLRQLHMVQRNEREVFNLKQKNVENQIAQLKQQLQAEVIKIQQQTAELSNDVKKVTVESMPKQSGIYYLNYFDMMIALLKDLRQKVGESRLWLNKSMHKKKQKGYWAMFKKHGMNFAASDERAVASSNG